jgi:hypothetical protein
MDDTPAGAFSCGVAMFRPQWLVADWRPGIEGVPLRSGSQARTRNLERLGKRRPV